MPKKAKKFSLYASSSSESSADVDRYRADAKCTSPQGSQLHSRKEAHQESLKRIENILYSSTKKKDALNFENITPAKYGAESRVTQMLQRKLKTENTEPINVKKFQINENVRPTATASRKAAKDDLSSDSEVDYRQIASRASRPLGERTQHQNSSKLVRKQPPSTYDKTPSTSQTYPRSILKNGSSQKKQPAKMSFIQRQLLKRDRDSQYTQPRNHQSYLQGLQSSAEKKIVARKLP